MSIIGQLVLFFYLIQNRLNENRLYTSVQQVSTVKVPSGYSPQPFQEPGTGLPTFSAQEVGQRKMPREIDHSNVNRKNLSTISDFGKHLYFSFALKLPEQPTTYRALSLYPEVKISSIIPQKKYLETIKGSSHTNHLASLPHHQ